MTKEEKIKEGTILVAIDVCKMDSTDEESLTIGKKYNVLSVDYKNREFVIIDDVLSKHYFDIDEYEEFFNLNKNDWSVIPSIHDKEIEKGQYWVMYPNGFIEVAYYDGTKECYKFWKTNFTHFHPIEKPEPPLF